MVYGVGFSVTTNAATTPGGPFEGGTAILTAPSTAGDIVTVVRAQPDERLNYYQNGGLFDENTVNPDFNQTILMIQQAQMYDNVLAPHYNVNESLDPDFIVDQVLPYLPAGYSWRKNSTNTGIEAFVAGAATVVSPTSASTVTTAITQVAHGFSAGDWVYISGTNTFVKGIATAEATAEVVGMVSAVADADNFTLQVGGLVTTGLAGLTAGVPQYLSPVTAGALTATRPTTATQVVKPLLVALGSTSGIMTNLLGVVL